MPVLLLSMLLACGGSQEAVQAPAAEPPAPQASTLSKPQGAPSAAELPVYEPKQDPLPWPPTEDRSPDAAVTEAQAKATTDKAGAIAQLDARLEQHPDDADALVLRSKLRPADQAEQALDEALRAVELDASYAGARIQVTDLLIPQRRCDEAMPHLAWVLEHFPDHANAWSNRAFCRFGSGDWGPALEDTERACELGLQEACTRLPGLMARYERRKALAEERARAKADSEGAAQPAPE